MVESEPKDEVSKTKKDISKRKTPICILKGLSNKQNFFSFHRHFKGARSRYFRYLV